MKGFDSSSHILFLVTHKAMMTGLQTDIRTQYLQYKFIITTLRNS